MCPAQAYFQNKGQAQDTSQGGNISKCQSLFNFIIIMVVTLSILKIVDIGYPAVVVPE